MAYPFNQLPDHVDAGSGKYAKLVQLTGSNVQLAGKTTAVTADGVLTANFHHVSVVNDGPNELKIAIDEDSTTSTKVIYIASGEPFEMNLKGSSLHHSVQSGSAVFRYVLS